MITKIERMFREILGRNMRNQREDIEPPGDFSLGEVMSTNRGRESPIVDHRL